MLLLSKFTTVAFLWALQCARAASLPPDDQLLGTNGLAGEKSIDVTSKTLRAVLPATSAQCGSSATSLISTVIPHMPATLPQTSVLSESETTLELTGFYVVAQYSDTACLSVLFSESKKLNYCTDNKDKTYTIYTASATEISGTIYSDPACTASIATAVLTKYNDACNSKVRIFVSDTGVLQSSAFMESFSRYPTDDAKCSDNNYYYVVHTAVNVCIPPMMATVLVSGTAVTITKYLTTDCTSFLGSATFQVGVCLLDVGFYGKYRSIAATLSSSPTVFVTSAPTTPLLTGYYVKANYGDADCQSVFFSESFLLNICTTNPDRTYTLYTATSTTESQTRYSDSSCSQVLVPTVTTTLSSPGSCVDKKRKFVSETGVPASSTFMESYGYYSSQDTACLTTSYYIVHATINICIPFMKATVRPSGDSVTVTVYSNTDCTGPSNSPSFLIGACLPFQGYNSKFLSVGDNPSGATTMAKDCFAGSETVRLESGEDRLISHINAGDRVLAADAAGKMSFSEVVFVPHKANKGTAAFVHITTASGLDIKMTRSHVLPAGACGNYSPLPLKYASLVTVDDCIMTSTGEEKVSSVGMALAEGAYTLVVTDEFIIVNGIVASPFAYNHIAGNLYYHIHRFLYSVTPGLLSSPLLRSSNEALGYIPHIIGYTAK